MKNKTITEKGLIRRINARLAETGYELCRPDFAAFTNPPIDPNRKFQILDAIGRELGVLKPHESVGAPSDFKPSYEEVVAKRLRRLR
ncbi:MAG: hypothetical protein ABSB50_20725 [Terracidiphilus sp.]